MRRSPSDIDQLQRYGGGESHPRTLARRHDPSTSHDAAKSVASTLGRIQAGLMAAFAVNPRGLTPDEAEVVAGLHAGARRRVSELHAQGLIVPTGETRVGRSGRAQRVFIAVDTRSGGKVRDDLFGGFL
jgi:hypothetical protein